MIHGERRTVKFRQKNIGEDAHLIQTVLFCEVWKKTIMDSAEFVLDYSRKMVLSGDPLIDEQSAPQDFGAFNQ